MEYVREQKITIYVDTNKMTYNKILEPDEDEDIDDFLERVCEEYHSMVEGIN